METEKEASIRNPGPSPTWYRRDHRPDLSRWEIPLCGELTDRQADLLEQVSEVPRNSRGLMYFDSCGGSVYTGLALATLMRVRGLRVSGVVIGECSSAALLPFAACQKRFVTPHSTLLFHPMRWQSDEDVKLEEATEWARHFKDLELRLDTLLQELFGVDQSLLHGWTRPGRFVTGAELAAAGLASLFDPFKDSDPWKTICAQ